MKTHHEHLNRGPSRGSRRRSSYGRFNIALPAAALHRHSRPVHCEGLGQPSPSVAAIPFAPEFRPFAKAGEKLAKLHLDYEQLKPWDLDFVETPGVPLSYRVEDKMRLAKDRTRITVNPSLTLAGIPPQVFEYRPGNRSALDWVIDQYQVSTDKRSGITSDPNREDDPQYIVRLVGQVIRVSMETVAIVNGLPTEFEPAVRSEEGKEPKTD